MKVCEKSKKNYFVGTYEGLNWLCRYTRTRPWNETKLDRCVLYIKESVYVFIDSKLYVRLLSYGKRLLMYKKAVSCWYIAMAYPSDFNFGMQPLHTMVIYYLR